MECYLFSEPKIRGYRKRIQCLWLAKGMFWESEWMTDLEIEELERKVTGSDSFIAKDARSVEALPDHVGEDVRYVLLEMGAEEQSDSLHEEEVAIVMEIAEVIQKGRKDKLPALRNVPKKKLLEETAKVDKVLTKFKTHSITKTKNNKITNT